MQTRWTVLLLPLLWSLSACHGEPAVITGEDIEYDEATIAHRLAELHATPMHNAPEAGAWVAGNPERPDCVRCHEPGTAAEDARTDPEDRDAHWDIMLTHAEGMTCRTCHMPTEPERLKGMSGVDGHGIDMNEAYRACADCHSGQVADWRGGAHGKRLTGWAEPRVVKNCSGCHNPHDPSIKSRFPVAHPTIVPERLRK